MLTPAVASRLVKRVGDPRPTQLSQRELEVLSLVATGQTNAEIGRALFISEATVKAHLLRVFSRLDVSERTAAVTTAMPQGLPRSSFAAAMTSRSIGPGRFTSGAGSGTLATCCRFATPP